MMEYSSLASPVNMCPSSYFKVKWLSWLRKPRESGKPASLLALLSLANEDLMFFYSFRLGLILNCSYFVQVRTPKPANMSSKRTKAKTTKKRPQRATSNVFAMFDQSQIQEFKEAFNMIDQNRDGFVDKEDLHDMLASLGELHKNEWMNK